MKLKRFLNLFTGLILSAILTLAPAVSTFALSRDRIKYNAVNNIVYYDPTFNRCYSAAGHSDGSDVTIIGDSITVLSEAAIKAVLPKAEIDAESGTYFAKNDYGTSGIDRLKAMGDSARDIIVFAMGTNGGVTTDEINELLSVTGEDKKVILMTLIGVSKEGTVSSFYDSSNSAIKSAASKSNVSLADWALEVKSSNPTTDLIDVNSENASIYVHPTATGQQSFAKIIQDAVNKVTKLGSPSALPSSGSGYERLKEAVKLYGQKAMEMQKKFGTPWEVVLAQMQMESSVGTAGIAVSGATNNWLGITGTGDAGSWTSSSGRKWAVYSSVEASIEDWAGWRVLRNGYYDAAFQHLDPNHYDLESFLVEMIHHYAPSSDGNNEQVYVSSVLSFINGPIREAREALGWPSSEEFAKQNSVGIGGENPLGTSGGGGSGGSGGTTNYVGNCPVGAGNGDINLTAIDLSWPDRSHAPTDPNDAYRTALTMENGVGTRGEGDTCSIGGYSCDAFLASVMRYSGADPDFPCCGADNQRKYMMNHPELYEEIPNIGNASNLQPGDIRAHPGHVEIYVVLDDGTGHIASASHCDRTADHASNYYPDSRFQIFRFRGGH